MSFNTTVTDTFTIKGSPAAGIVTIHADGYGTLLLPEGQYEDVLRVVITGSHPWFKYQVYAWFDNKHASALLIIDDKSNVEYLLEEKWEK